MTRFTPLVLLSTAAAVVTAQTQVEGCYSSAGSLQSQGEYIYQSTGYCADTCKQSGATIIALTAGSTCYCGNEVPSAGDKVDDSRCSTQCQGYPAEMCGGDGVYSVYAITSEEGWPWTSNSSSSTAAASMPTSGGNGTATAPSVTRSEPASTSASAQYTGVAAKQAVGAGALAIGALAAVL